MPGDAAASARPMRAVPDGAGFVNTAESAREVADARPPAPASEQRSLTAGEDVFDTLERVTVRRWGIPH